jgi:hypothetical protein
MSAGSPAGVKFGVRFSGYSARAVFVELPDRGVGAGEPADGDETSAVAGCDCGLAAADCLVSSRTPKAVPPTATSTGHSISPRAPITARVSAAAGVE